MAKQCRTCRDARILDDIETCRLCGRCTMCHIRDTWAEIQVLEGEKISVVPNQKPCNALTFDPAGGLSCPNCRRGGKIRWACPRCGCCRPCHFVGIEGRESKAVTVTVLFAAACSIMPAPLRDSNEKCKSMNKELAVLTELCPLPPLSERTCPYCRVGGTVWVECQQCGCCTGCHLATGGECPKGRPTE